jgi:hypothetical protein
MVSKVQLNQVTSKLPEAIDLFLCSASFETRCLSIPKAVAGRANYVIAFCNYEIENAAIDQVEEIKKMFVKNLDYVCISQADPIASTDKMIAAIKKADTITSIRSVVFDLTTFTHESLLIMYRLLYVILPDVEITFTYANAAEYDSAHKRDYKWLSKGLGEVRSVLGYPGNIMPNRRNFLIVIVGYEYERAISMIEAIEPSLLAIGFGDSDNATTEKNQEANEHYTHLVEEMSSSYDHIDRFKVKCDNPFETRDTITSLASKAIQSGYNVVVVPLNNKISTLGVGLSAIANEDIQICYAPALIYNYENYSVPGQNVYIIKEDQKH